jgi:hypothetical protein
MTDFQFKKLFFLFAVLLAAFSAVAQQDHFVYLQTDNGKPFYVRMNSKILSSSSEGYIIIPNITDGVYQLKVGFPKKEYPEESFTISVNKYNEGYLIKHFEDKGLQLFNMETLALISGNKDTISSAVVTTEDNNPFTKMLATVVKDSSILQNHELAIENPAKVADTSGSANTTAEIEISSPPDTSTVMNIPTQPVDSAVAANTGSVASTLPAPDSSYTVATSDSQVSKLLSRKDDKGLQMIYADHNGNDNDTVRVFMPLAKKDIPAGSKATNNGNSDRPSNKIYSSADTSLTITPTIIKPENEQKGFVMRKDTLSVATDSASVDPSKTAPEQVFYIGPEEKNKESQVEKPANEKKGLFSGLNSSKNSDKEKDKTEKKPVNKIEMLPKVVTSSEVNSDCKEFADNEDFLRLRKKMASENNKEDMIKVARKAFKTRCFSTAQIKDLSFLFLTDEGKYMFFDAAYPHTSDSDQFNSLEAQLRDPYYKTRFEAMIRH